MLPLIAFVLLYGWLTLRTLSSSARGFDTFLLWAIPVGVVVAMFIRAAALPWPGLAQRSQDRRSRNWPTVSGIIDIAAVDEQVESGGRSGPIIYYLVMLTYSYRNPELQTGDYTRRFQYETDAQDWAASCKGRTVTVHVDPRDPAQSVLRKEDLLGG